MRQQLAYLYFEDEPQRQMSMKRLSRDEAFLIAVNIAKLPSVPRQILKDIPRPPNTVSRMFEFQLDSAQSDIVHCNIIDSGSALQASMAESVVLPPVCKRRAAYARSKSDASISGSLPPAELPKMLSTDGFDAL